jgi:SAM-dependent methyltransferase
MPKSDLYIQPAVVKNLADCNFYHAVDLPGHGSVLGGWDLRHGIDRYLGFTSFEDKRVLDVGAATGFLSFHMEKRGAEVVSYDLSPEDRWDVVPFAGTDVGQILTAVQGDLRRVRNSYWFCHRVFGSRNRVVYGTVYAIPTAIGPVDIATCGSILLHLRDPFLALQNVCRLTRETVIIADMVPRRLMLLWGLGRCFGSCVTPLFGNRMRFLPDARNKGECGTWWYLSPQLVRDVLAVLGFEDSRVVYHTQPFQGARRLMYTVIGRRTQPAQSFLARPTSAGAAA